MKRFLKKRWHSIPVGIVAVLMALILVAGGAFAAGYGFFTSALQVEVEEAMVVGAWNTWDNLKPYGSDTEAVWVDGDPGAGTLGDVAITLGGTSEEPTVSIATIEGYAGAGFVAGEWIVIPLNIRNGSSGELTLSASVAGDVGDNLVLGASYEENFGPQSSLGPEGQSLCREYKAIEDFNLLDNWSAIVPGNSGKSGSAIVGAKVLFVRIFAPGDAAPETYTLTVTLERS